MSTTAPNLPSIAYPGLSLASAAQHVPGPGTHVHDGQIVASLAGRPIIITPSPPSSSTTSTKSSKAAPPEKSTITIPRILPSAIYAPIPSANISNTNILPRVGCTVLARVLRVRTRQVDVGILCVGTTDTSSPQPATSPGKATPTPTPVAGDHATTTTTTTFHPCTDDYPAVLRREDIRATEKDKLVCSEGFRVGDVLRGEVISVGDQANYYLSTARNDLGVVMARSEREGDVMAPVSWREFVELGTGRREGRKVAKPF